MENKLRSVDCIIEVHDARVSFLHPITVTHAVGLRTQMCNVETASNRHVLILEVVNLLSTVVSLGKALIGHS